MLICVVTTVISFMYILLILYMYIPKIKYLIKTRYIAQQ